jgi:hypothetical protein
MATFAGLVQPNVATLLDGNMKDNGTAVDATLNPYPKLPVPVPDPIDLTLEMFNQVAGPGKTNFVANAVHVALWHDVQLPEWFENYHVVPRSFDFGNILSAQSSPLTVFSGYRRTQGTWSSFVNNAGAGTSLSGAPAIPATMYPLEGYEMTLEISTNGNPSVDDTLDFVFDSGATTIFVPIVLNRIVLFPIRPEIPYIEKLQFLTDIIEHEDGSEQRIAARKNPRQIFEWDVRMDDGTFDNGRFDSLMFDWQSRTWGVPMWHEATDLTVDAPAGTLTINVGSTADADYRVDGLVMIFTDASTFDVQTIDSFTATTITLKNVTILSHDIGASVAPMRAGNLEKQIGTSRWTSGDQTAKLRFRILDNDANLADTTPFATYNSKVLLEDCNVMRGNTKQATLLRELILIDNNTGLTFQDSPWDNGMSAYPLTLRANSRSELWDLRGLLHALRGRQVSFYIPTFRQDLIPNQNLLTASQDLNIVNMGYVQFVRDRQPKDRVWVRLKDGTTITKQITSSVEVDPTTETLVVDSVWGSNIDLADIDRISYLEEVRFDTDEIEIRYDHGERQVYVSGPVRSILP